MWGGAPRSGTTLLQRCYRAGFVAAQAAPDRCLTVHYEALVHDSRAEIRRICDFLRLPWSEEMLSPASKRHAGEKQMTSGFENLFYDPATFRQDPDPRRAEKWKAVPTPLQNALIVDSFDRFEHRGQLPRAVTSEVLGAPARAAARAYRLLLGLRRRLALAAARSS